MVKGKTRILVRSPNWLGDAVMALPFLENLRVAYPKAYLAVWCKPHLMPVFEAYQKIDEVIAYENSFLRLLKSCCKLGQNFDICILLPNSFSSALAAFLTHIPRRIGYTTDGRHFLLTHRYPPPKGHQVNYYLQLLKYMGLKVKASGPVLFPTAKGQAEQKRLWEQFRWQKDYIVFAPGAAYGPAKCWPPASFAKLAVRIKDELGLAVIMLGSSKDKQIAKQILEHVKKTDGLYDLTGLTSLAGAMAIIKEALLVVTNDSGLMHLTAALDRPQIAIFGPTDPTKTSPYGNKTKIIHHPVSCAPCKARVCPKDHRCMREIKVEEVFGEVKKLVT